MNPQQFSELARDPGALGPETLQEIEQLLKQYPYFQSAHVLYALNLLKTGSPAYQNQLKKAVVYAGDRRKLKELLEGKKPYEHVPAVVPVEETHEAAAADDHQLSEAERPATDQPEEAIQALEKQGVQGPVNESREIYIEDSLITSEELDLATPVEPAAEPEFSPRPGSLHDLKISSAVTKEKVSQEDLLSVVRKRLAEINAEKSGRQAPKAVTPDAEGETKSGTQERAGTRPLPKDILIEKFIQEEPKISRPRKEFFNPATSSQRSNIDEEDIVSETLALLYARQGNLQKAIHIYEKLSLRFSEKSRYFAAQIENLKLNSNQ